MTRSVHLTAYGMHMAAYHMAHVHRDVHRQQLMHGRTTAVTDKHRHRGRPVWILLCHSFLND